MPSIAARISFKKDLLDNRLMTKMLCSMDKNLISVSEIKEEYYKENMYIKNNINLGTIAKENILKYKFSENEYVIILDGEIFNKDEIKNELVDAGFKIETNLSEEIVLKGYISFKEKILEKLNGNFAFIIWNEKEKSLFIARDHFGIKPMFYTVLDDEIIFSSEIKGILQNENVNRVLDRNTFLDLISFSPDHIPGKTYFKNIYELKSASFIKITRDNCLRSDIKEIEYWNLKNYDIEKDVSKNKIDSYSKNIKEILEDAIKKQIKYQEEQGCLLSGGLDSSIITTMAAKFYKEKLGKDMNVYSVYYKDNDKFFKATSYQKSQDDEYIEILVKKLGLKHNKIILDVDDLIDCLDESVRLRDCPGMADIDSSYLSFFKKMKGSAKYVFSGECSDEIFGGYPWYFKDEKNSNFPWSNGIKERQELIDKNLKDVLSLDVYENIRKVYEEEEAKCKDCDTHKKKMYLTINYFMKTLIDRTDRVARVNNINAYVPFCDYRLVEYLYNIPFEYKCYLNIEKGLLRYAYKDILPKEIINRKKSPYPKTYNPQYTNKVKEKLSDIINKNDSKIIQVLDKEYILNVIKRNGENFEKPWFGQLMKGPQFMAYLIQLEYWLEEYNIRFIM